MRLAAFLSASLLSGCVHRIGLNNEEECAVRGMVLDGVSVSDSSGSASSYNWESNSTTTHHYSGTTERAICLRPKSPPDECVIKAHSASADAKHEFNDNVGTRNLLTGIGYVLWILPGVAFYYVFDDQRDKVIARAQEIGGGATNCAPAH